MPKKRFSYLRWTPEHLQRLKALRKEGKGLVEIAEVFGVRKCAVTSTIKRYDLDREVQYWKGVETRLKVFQRISLGPIKNKELRNLCGIQTSQMFRILDEMIRNGLIRRCKHGYYEPAPRKEKDE